MIHRVFRPLRPPRAGAPPTCAPLIAGAEPFHTPLPARPFAVAIAPAGERAFVSMPRPGARGFCVLSPGAPWQLERAFWMPDAIVPRGMALDGTGRHLLAANSAGGLIVVDAEALATGVDDPHILILESPGAGSMQLCLDGAERFAFVTDEDSASVSVFDFGDSLASGRPTGRLVGRAAVPPAPVGLALSPDGAYLFVTCQGRGAGGRGDGVLAVLSAHELQSDPRRTPVITSNAGADPVRVAVSPDGEIAWVSARGSNSLLAFDIAELVRGGRRALRAVVRVGAAPVGLALLHGGSIVVAANSNRYGGGETDPQTLSVVDAAAALGGRDGLVGVLPAGIFPREITALPDDRTVLVTNVRSQSLQAISVVR
jgi:DNA-binding beta-propeller fold protein YncE